MKRYEGKHIIRNGEKVYLTQEDQCYLRDQQYMIDALDAIDGQCENADKVLEFLTDEQLVDIGKAINSDYMRESGEREWHSLRGFPLEGFRHGVIGLDESFNEKGARTEERLEKED